MAIRDILLKLGRREDLSRAEAHDALAHLMSGQAGEAQIGAMLMGLAAKGASVEELVGAAEAMREQSVRLEADPAGVVLDTCGTGGDVRGTFNISTAAALIAAAAGVRVVKHGNRSASSRCGSADVLEKLGVNLELRADRLSRCLQETNICFAFARNHHPAMRHVADARKQLGIPTIFNLLGPLTNPGRARHQLLGVWAARWTEPLADALGQLGSERAWVVHAEDGLDELSTLVPTRISELDQSRVRTWTLDPGSLGFGPAKLADLQVSDVDQAAAALREVLDGRSGPRRDIALLNAAAGLVIAGRCADLAAGLATAASAVDSGAARRTLDALIRCSQAPA